MTFIYWKTILSAQYEPALYKSQEMLYRWGKWNKLPTECPYKSSELNRKNQNQLEVVGAPDRFVSVNIFFFLHFHVCVRVHACMHVCICVGTCDYGCWPIHVYEHWRHKGDVRNHPPSFSSTIHGGRVSQSKPKLADMARLILRSIILPKSNHGGKDIFGSHIPITIHYQRKLGEKLGGRNHGWMLFAISPTDSYFASLSFSLRIVLLTWVILANIS